MLSQHLQHELQQFETYLLTSIQNLTYPEHLKESVQYSLLAGGKRIRPLLSIAIAKAAKIPSSSVYPLAAAIEMIHTYSLIHDDLPAMDDDDLRRGKPTNHIVFDEATAILAGDALLTESFHQMTLLSVPATIIVDLIQSLSACAGGGGMVGGQILDIAAENKTVTLSELRNIHYLKTGKMIEIAVVGAAKVAQLSDEKIQQLQHYSEAVGVAFQIQDDSLDVVGTTQQLGKPQGSDLTNGKSTYVSLLGLVGAKRALESEYERALQCLIDTKMEISELLELTRLICQRQG